MFGTAQLKIRHVRISEPLPAPQGNPLRIALHVCVLLFSASLSVFMVGSTALARTTAAPSAAPVGLGDYADLLPGQAESEVVARGFSCYADAFDRSYALCTVVPASGAFSLVSVMLRRSLVTQLTFLVRQDTPLRVGDLPLAWGRPRAGRIDGALAVRWSALDRGIDAWLAGDSFSFFNPVIRLRVTPP
jgi:hypothetical protein